MESKPGISLQNRKAELEQTPAKIRKLKLTGRKSEPCPSPPSLSPIQTSAEAEQVTIKTEPNDESPTELESLPMLRRSNKLTYRKINSRSMGSFQESSPVEKDELTIESLIMDEEDPGVKTEPMYRRKGKETISLLRKNLINKRKSEKLGSPKPKRVYTPRGTKAKVTPLLVGPIPHPQAGPSGLVLPKIESTITACSPPHPGSSSSKSGYHSWDETIDSVVRACLKKGTEESQSQAEFTLPPSTTMTPITVPTTLPLSIQTQDMAPKPDDTLLLMVIPQPVPVAATTSSAIEVIPIPCEGSPVQKPVQSQAPPQSAAGSIQEGRPRKSTSQMSPYQSPLAMTAERDLDLPNNYATNIVPLQALVGDLNQETVMKWLTKDVADFVAKIPGCISAAQGFTEQVSTLKFTPFSESDYLYLKIIIILIAYYFDNFR